MAKLSRQVLERTIAEVVGHWHGLSVDTAIIEMEPIIKILLAKDADYGSGNLYKTGIAGVMVRIADKATRIENLDGKQALVVDEAILDTLYDLIGYALRGIILEKERMDRHEG